MSNVKKKSIVISASMAILAVHAMNLVAKNADGVVSLPEVKTTDELAAKIDAAVGRPSVQEAVNASFALLATKFGHGDVSLGEKYFPGASEQVLADNTTAKSRDFTAKGCYAPPTYSTNTGTTCYAPYVPPKPSCHGSRSWR
ncbi:hypothetical protein [Rhizobium sp. BK176]|uniref:hypothetical protein n=1 Tax=Rhizobium sp. BK176 TaxID=2587071 RepID=UPI002168171F|nr:hypothetical protein [Rhizobium sp. BK176]MCS4089483.1 hypothetical protein [Rhizobium sp. BK176]